MTSPIFGKRGGGGGMGYTVIRWYEVVWPPGLAGFADEFSAWRT